MFISDWQIPRCSYFRGFQGIYLQEGILQRTATDRKAKLGGYSLSCRESHWRQLWVCHQLRRELCQILCPLVWTLQETCPHLGGASCKVQRQPRHPHCQNRLYFGREQRPLHFWRGKLGFWSFSQPLRLINLFTQVNGFPTIFIYRDGEKITEYNGSRSLDDLHQFVLKHSVETVKDEL